MDLSKSSTVGGGGRLPGQSFLRRYSLFCRSCGNGGFRWLRKNRVPLSVITSLCLFSLMYTSIVTQSRIWEMTDNFKSWSPLFKYARPKVSSVDLDQHSSTGCQLQKPDPFAPRMMALINMTIFRSNHSCSNDPGLGIFKWSAFHVEKGHLLVRDVKFPRKVKCCWKEVTRVEDEFVSIDEDCNELQNNVNQTTAIEPPTEVVMVTCKNSKNKNFYIDAFQILHEKPEVEKRIKNWEEEQLKLQNVNYGDGRLSVIILGVDKVSQMQFDRSMPLSKRFLDEELKAVRIIGYNKVADNSFPNVMPLISGLTGEEFFSACIVPSNSTRWDGGKHRYLNCPFIWNTFGSHGYRTAFFDEHMPVSLFNLDYYNGFAHLHDGPTDYYGRPYALLMERKLGFGGACHGPRLSFQHLLDNVKTMADMFNSSQRPYINFIWASLLSHPSYSTLPWGDKPLLEALKYLHENGHFNHTAFFFLSDHGPRGLDDIYEAMIENRMPLAYIVLPPWFSQRYPKAFENLQWNGENSVASPFDMYKTIQDMLDLNRFDGNDDNWRGNRHFPPKNPKVLKRGQSLFERNPEQQRSCKSAGIPPLWCLCREMVIPLENDSILAVAAAVAVIEEVNRKMEKYSQQCEKVKVHEIFYASAILFSEETWEKPECQQVIKGSDYEYEVSNSSSSSCNETIHISIRIGASPQRAVFQTVVLRNSTGGFSAPNEIVREDWYSEKGYCVENYLRPYCVCKDL